MKGYNTLLVTKPNKEKKKKDLRLAIKLVQKRFFCNFETSEF